MTKIYLLKKYAYFMTLMPIHKTKEKGRWLASKSQLKFTQKIVYLNDFSSENAFFPLFTLETWTEWNGCFRVSLPYFLLRDPEAKHFLWVILHKLQQGNKYLFVYGSKTESGEKIEDDTERPFFRFSFIFNY